MRRNILLSLLGLCVLLLAYACSVLPQAEAVQGSEYDEALQMGAPVAEEIFQAIDDQDYAAFSQYFDETMKKALTEEAFAEMGSTFADRIGQYTGGKVTKIERIENLYVYTYELSYTQEEAVSARLTLRQGEPPQVAGLWFDSPKLRE